MLPLGDFSLMSDLPNMYRSYTKIVKEEPDVLDFIGDYLMNGKAILGHNKHDTPESPDTATQFQHQANSLNIVLTQLLHPVVNIALILNKHPSYQQTVYTSNYNNQLFRPPHS